MKKRKLEEHLVEQLKDREFACGYLNGILKEQDAPTFLVAIRLLTQAQGENVAEIMRQVGYDRTTFYRAFQKQGNPGFVTTQKFLQAMGFELMVVERKKLNHPRPLR